MSHESALRETKERERGGAKIISFAQMRGLMKIMCEEMYTVYIYVIKL